MSHCHGESHDHDHHGHGHGHVHDHTDDVTPVLQNLLYDQVNFPAIETMNEKRDGSGRAITEKRWNDRMNDKPELESDVDPEVLINVPFTGIVRLQHILIRTSASPSAPKTLNIHLNRDDLNFDQLSQLKPTQKLMLSQTEDVQELPVKRALFNSTRSVSLHFGDNFDPEGRCATAITYLGFKGEYIEISNDIGEITYEAAANPSDHKLTAGTERGMGSHIGGGGSNR